MRGLADRAVLGSTVGALTGGRWAISWIAYVVNAPVNLIVIGSNAGSTSPDAPWATWLLASAIGYLAFGLVFLIAHLTWFTNRSAAPRSLSSVVLLGGLAGGARGLTVGLLAATWGLTPREPVILVERIAIGVALGAILVPLVAFMLGCIDAYRTQRDTLIAQSRQLRASTMREAGLSAELEQALLTSVRDELDEVARTRDPAVARQVSHRIWDEPAPPVPEPRMHWSAVLRASVQHNPFATLPVAGIWAIAAIGTLTTSIGLTRAAAQIAFSLAMIAIGFAIGRRLVARIPRHAGTVFVIVTALLVLITGPVASTLFDPRPWPAGAALVIANTLWLPLLTIGAGFVSAALRASEAVLADLVALVSEDELAAIATHDEHERLRRELATRLHGTVQSRLLAASALSADPDARAAWASRHDDLDIAARPAGSLVEELARITEPWSALMSIDVRVDTGLTRESAPGTNGETTEAITRIVEEGLTNAFRHGHATCVGIEIHAEGEAILITVTDNGTGITEGSAPGMGSAVLDALAPASWTLQKSTGGTTLTARLRARPT